MAVTDLKWVDDSGKIILLESGSSVKDSIFYVTAAVFFSACYFSSSESESDD